MLQSAPLNLVDSQKCEKGGTVSSATGPIAPRGPGSFKRQKERGNEPKPIPDIGDGETRCTRSRLWVETATANELLRLRCWLGGGGKRGRLYWACVQEREPLHCPALQVSHIGHRGEKTEPIPILSSTEGNKRATSV